MTTAHRCGGHKATCEDSITQTSREANTIGQSRGPGKSMASCPYAANTVIFSGPKSVVGIQKCVLPKSSPFYSDKPKKEKKDHLEIDVWGLKKILVLGDSKSFETSWVKTIHLASEQIYVENWAVCVCFPAFGKWKGCMDRFPHLTLSIFIFFLTWEHIGLTWFILRSGVLGRTIQYVIRKDFKY